MFLSVKGGATEKKRQDPRPVGSKNDEPSASTNICDPGLRHIGRNAGVREVTAEVGPDVMVQVDTDCW